MEPSTPGVPSRPAKRRRTSRRRVNPVVLVCVVAAILGLGVAARRFLLRSAAAANQPLAGYITGGGTVTREYVKFKGKAPQSADIAVEFDQAALLAQKGEYPGALASLEALSKEAAVPAVYNDIGVLYMLMNDHARAINAFREALARDVDYAPVRANLRRLGERPDSADPVSTEIEPNNTDQFANFVGLNKPVDAEITAADADEDCFRFVTPPAPRDRIEISFTNRSATLEPRLRMYDGDGVILPWEKTVRQPGASFSIIIAPEPGVPLFVHVSGDQNTGGAYSLRIKPLKAYDRYEPNDDIYSASKISLGQKIDANIMDANDTDFYSFVADHTGSVAIDIENRSSTLMPAVTTFAPDMRTTGFGPDVHAPGDSLHYAIAVQEGSIYYLQVWSQGKTSGDYSLTLTSHPFLN